MSELKLDKDYIAFLTDIKEKIKSAQLRAVLAVNQEAIQLYWQMGKEIIKRQIDAKWGDKLLDVLSHDLQVSFPEMRGFSKTNLKYMRIFAHLYPDGIGQQPVDQLPWGHVTILIRIKEDKIRHWYLQESLNIGWSRHMLEKQIKGNLYNRKAINQKKTSNYLSRLPLPQSSLAQELLKNPYNLDFLGLHDEAHEREVEQAATKHITKFLLELGKGFAFVGTQFPLEISGKDFFIDMLFYHLKLHSYVVIEIKSVPFKPEHTGQLNFYLNAVDDLIKMPEDNPSIGILLCKSHDKVIAEYALKGIEKPIGISEYQLTQVIPDNLKGSLPTIQEIEEELSQFLLEKPAGEDN